MQWFRDRSEPRFRPVADPTERQSLWNQGWRLMVAWGAVLMIVLLGLAHLVLLMEVFEWWLRL